MIRQHKLLTSTNQIWQFFLISWSDLRQPDVEESYPQSQLPLRRSATTISNSEFLFSSIHLSESANSNSGAGPPIRRPRLRRCWAWPRHRRRTGWSCTGNRRNGFRVRRESELRVSDILGRRRWRSEEERFRDFRPARSWVVGCNVDNVISRPAFEASTEGRDVGRHKFGGVDQNSCRWK